MFRKILIANRGEIACRVMRTAKRLGIRTVAVYSDVDRDALHVRTADEAYGVEYLNGAAIIEVCKRSGVEAVHPGYGFLSENAGFAEDLKKAGIIFIGPDAASIRAMGLKDAAKELMKKADVPVVPGYQGKKQGYEFLAKKAEEIGYPVLIKARAGGGGKGMRRVDNVEDFKEALEGAQREGEKSFGDGHVLIEKYLEKPRHIEVQVFGDRHGNVVHLFERDCSLQRRHQKVIEEAPAPGMSEEMRKIMGKAAVRAAKAVDYVGAGTVEFIADVSDGLKEERFYFMEMNTRLQVEHPVTECIVGYDLVEWQLRVAAGEKLPVKQKELSIDGWAVEARVYAENVPAGFLPATGKLHYMKVPDGIRVDTGVEQGDEISPHYDPMIAKVIAHGDSREVAIRKLAAALKEFHIAGCVTNVSFLSELCLSDGFMKGDVDTGYIERVLDGLDLGLEFPFEAVALAALKVGGFLDEVVGDDPWDTLKGWRSWGTNTSYCWLGDLGVSVSVLENSYVVRGDEQELRLSVLRRDGEMVDFEFQVDGITGKSSGTVIISESKVNVFLDGKSYVFEIPLAGHGAQEESSSDEAISAPMPGLVKVVSCSDGQDVTKGETLVVLEAMKMEHSLVAPYTGKVADVKVAEGDQVVEGGILIVMESADAA